MKKILIVILFTSGVILSACRERLSSSEVANADDIQQVKWEDYEAFYWDVVKTSQIRNWETNRTEWFGKLSQKTPQPNILLSTNGDERDRRPFIIIYVNAKDEETFGFLVFRLGVPEPVKSFLFDTRQNLLVIDGKGSPGTDIVAKKSSDNPIDILTGNEQYFEPPGVTGSSGGTIYFVATDETSKNFIEYATQSRNIDGTIHSPLIQINIAGGAGGTATIGQKQNVGGRGQDGKVRFFFAPVTLR